MKYLLPLIMIIVFSCQDQIDDPQFEQLIFVASEGNFGNGDGSIAVFDESEKIQVIDNIGDVVQSITVHEDFLFVIINNSHVIKRYQITESGLTLPGIEVPTDNSSPREMVIMNDKLFFTNWNSKDVKVLSLTTYEIENSIELDLIPEDIVSDGNYLWVSTPNLSLYDKNEGSNVIKIDLETLEVEEIFEVGLGPQHMIIDDGMLWISRTYYNDSWEAFYGSSSIDTRTGETLIINYGSGSVCGGNLVKLNNQIYRTADGGIVPLLTDLSLNLANRVGNHGSVYSAGSDNYSAFLGTSDYASPDTVYIHNEDGNIIRTLNVNVLPGDYAVWNN